MAIFWIMLGSLQTASSRIHGYQIHNYLVKNGYDSNLLVAPPNGLESYDIPWKRINDFIGSNMIKTGDVVIFETVGGENAQLLAQMLKQINVLVVVVECDLFENKIIYNYSDLIVCTSIFLTQFISRNPSYKTTFIPDPVEKILWKDEITNRTRNKYKNLRLCWVGNAEHWETVMEVKKIISLPEFTDLEIVTVSNHKNADVKWSTRNAYRELLKCDVAIVPTSNTLRALSKSNNRVTQAMALGAPVIAGDIPAYHEVIVNGENGFLCKNRLDWIEAFRMVRDPLIRRKISANGLDLIHNNFTIDVIGKRWEEIFTKSQNFSEYKTENKRIIPIKFQVESSLFYLNLYRKKALPIGFVRKYLLSCLRKFNN